MTMPPCLNLPPQVAPQTRHEPREVTVRTKGRKERVACRQGGVEQRSSVHMKCVAHPYIGSIEAAAASLRCLHPLEAGLEGQLRQRCVREGRGEVETVTEATGGTARWGDCKYTSPGKLSDGARHER